MTERTWLPTQYQEDAIPPTRATPSDWIIQLDDGTYALAPNELWSGRADPVLLKEGDIVDFDWTERYGALDLTIHVSEDGEKMWELHGIEPAVSNGGNLLVAISGDWDTTAFSVDELVENHDAGEGETLDVVFFGWSIVAVPHVFRDGAFVAEQSLPTPAQGAQ